MSGSGDYISSEGALEKDFPLLKEAADAIEKLLSRLQNAINWTSVEKDGLPSEPGASNI